MLSYLFLFATGLLRFSVSFMSLFLLFLIASFSENTVFLLLENRTQSLHCDSGQLFNLVLHHGNFEDSGDLGPSIWHGPTR